jgi:hypothetical protein
MKETDTRNPDLLKLLCIDVRLHLVPRPYSVERQDES